MTTKATFHQLLAIYGHHNSPFASIIAIVLALVAFPIFALLISLELPSCIPFSIGPCKLCCYGAQRVMVFRLGIQEATEVVHAAVG